MAANAVRTTMRDGAPPLARSAVVISRLSKARKVRAGNRNGGRLLRSAKDDRGLRRTNVVERTNAVDQQLIERRRVARAHLQHEAVFARDVVNFLDFWDSHERC